jgi:sortase A
MLAAISHLKTQATMDERQVRLMHRRAHGRSPAVGFVGPRSNVGAPCDALTSWLSQVNSMRSPPSIDGPGTGRTSRAFSLWIERVAWSIGVVAIGWWAAASVAGTRGARQEVERFAAIQAGAVGDPAAPDQSLWSPERVRAWRETRTTEAPAPLALLRIPRIGLEVAVLEGTDDWTLNRAAGHIEDTPTPGAGGNSGIAGHRDGFFRGLKDIRPGDGIEIETVGSIERYTVERTWVVAPEDVSVLDPTATPSITLVTCYPFYFVGPAPQRFIVRAVRTETAARRQAPRVDH